jgi:hypothetical protein
MERRTTMSDDSSSEHTAGGEFRASLLRTTFGFSVLQLGHVAAQLHIADLLKDGAKSSAELARATGTHPPSLHRLLRCLAGMGMLNEIESGRFELSCLKTSLQTGTPKPARALPGRQYDEPGWRSWAHLLQEARTNKSVFEHVFDVGALLYSVRTGQPAFEHVVGMDTFTYFARNPQIAATVHGAMAGSTRQVAPAIISACDFSRFRTIVDVGGGNGTLIAMILHASPGAYGIVFDTPTGAAAALRHIETVGLNARCRVVAGDFFESVPGGGDAYILKHVVHDWDDDRSITILRNCRWAMPTNGRLLLIESLLPARMERPTALLRVVMSDLVCMLMSGGGRERTEDELRMLLTSANFSVTAVMSPYGASHFSVIEAVPARMC